MAEFDTIVRRGMVIDGTRLPRYQADIAIANGRVAEIGHIAAHRGKRVIDADGLIVAPGFVDLHCHYDAQLFWDPYCSLSGWHGVTSLVIGNCGFGFAPVRPEERDRAMLTMTRVEAIPYATMKAAMPWNWVTFPEFLDAVDAAPKAVNILPFVPLAPLLIWTMGLDGAKTREPTADEWKEMRRLLHEAMDAGGCGWSAQRLPPQGGFANQRDYDGTPMATDVMSYATAMQFAEVLGERNEGFMQMTIATGDVKRDKGHMEDLARASGRPIIYNVIQPNVHYPTQHLKEIDWLERCRRSGIRIYGQGVTCDAGLEFTFEDWNNFDDAEAWCEATLGTVAERKAKLADPKRRPGLRANMPKSFVGFWEEIVCVNVVNPELKRYLNLTLSDISELEDGKHIVDCMLDIAVADDLKATFWTRPTMSPQLIKDVVDYPYALFGISDGGAHAKFSTAGRYPTHAIETLVREYQWIDLEEAHYRLSALPARCAGFKDRGTLVEGAPADIIVYDYENLRCLPAEKVYDLPANEWRRVCRAEGYAYVFVNGEITSKAGEPTGAFSGKLLRHGSAQAG